MRVPGPGLGMLSPHDAGTVGRAAPGAHPSPRPPTLLLPTAAGFTPMLFYPSTAHISALVAASAGLAGCHRAPGCHPGLGQDYWVIWEEGTDPGVLTQASACSA